MKNYLEQIKQYLTNDDFESLDTLLEQLYFKIPEEERNKISDIIDEATLYSELKEDDYKNVALNLIDKFNK